MIDPRRAKHTDMEYEKQDNIVTISFDDGKANIVSHDFLESLEQSLDRCESESVGAIVLRGREGMFSAGFDLKEFAKGPEAGAALALRGFRILLRLHSFPIPLIAAATGHTVAMGAFIVMACDLRIATKGPFKITLPETQISMDLPPVLLSLTASRIAKSHMTRAALLSEVFSPDDAVIAGFFDDCVDPEQLDAHCHTLASRLAELPREQFAKNKLDIRAETLNAMRTDIEAMAARAAAA